MTSARILIVGTEIDAAHLSACLTDLGYTVCAAVRSGRQAIATADKLHPDLALIDLGLEGPVGGIAAAASIRSRCDIPVIYVTDETAASRLPQARQTEPAGYLFKPFAKRQLHLSIDAALCAHGREAGHRAYAALLESTLQSAAEGVVVTDQDGQFLFINSRAEEIIGTFTREPDAARWHELYGVFQLDGETPFPIEDLPLMRARSGQGSDDVEMLIRHEGRPEGVYISASGRPLVRGNGDTPRSAVVVFHDISKLKKTEAELRKTIGDLTRHATLMDTMLDSINDGLMVTDHEGTIVLANRAAIEIFGTRPIEPGLARRSDYYGLYYPDRVTKIPPHDLPTGRAIRGLKTDSLDVFVRNDRKPKGILISVSGNPLYDSAGAVTGSVIVVKDVTNIRDTERRLRDTTAQVQAENRTKATIFNSISDGVVVADEDGQFVMFNPSAERLLGLGAIDTTPDRWSERFGVFFPDKITRVPTEDLPLMRAIRGESTDQEEFFIRNEGVPYGTYISVSGRPMRDPDGHSKGGVIVFRDVTKQIESDRALGRAFAQGRLEVVDTILHNIGNAVNSVSIGVGTVYAELRSNAVLGRFLALAKAIEPHRHDWLTYLTTDPQGREVVPFILALASDFRTQSDRLIRTVERMSSRVAHVVDIIRTQNSFDEGAMARKVVNLQDSITDAVKVLAESLTKRGIKLRLGCEKAPKEIRIQESRLHQMLVNVVKNSIEAIDELAQSKGVDEPLIRIDCCRHNGFLVVDVIDNGIGIAAADRARIFTAGFSTKSRGSGLGLHSAANFVIGSGGKINVISDGEGKGTTMRLMLRCESAGDSE